MRKYLYLVAAIAITIISSCKKKDEGFVPALVVDSGDITTRGCGYLLRFNDGHEEKPYQLLSAYQHNGLPVKVKYHVSDIQDTCGSSAPYSYFQLIIIDDIKNDPR
jgi:hypothetical protein